MVREKKLSGMIFPICPFVLLWAMGPVETNSWVISPAAARIPFSAANCRGFPCKTQQTIALPSTMSVSCHHSSPTALSLAKFPIPLWPYIGCSGDCGGGPLGLFLALTLCGVGLPISEDVLLIGLAPRLFSGNGGMTLLSKLLHVAAAVVGVATTDTMTLLLGRALRRNASVLGEKAPWFLRAMLVAIQKQLVTESQRDGARLREQIAMRLRVAGLDLKEQLGQLTADFNSGRWMNAPNLRHLFEPNLDEGDMLRNESQSSALWKRLEVSNTWVRRITCNTRTSLAAWGQESSSVVKRVASRITSRNNSPVRLSEDPSFLSGMDNRLALGQRWPLALLSGFSSSGLAFDYDRYFAGAALAALVVTLPVQLALGAALRDWARKLLYVLIATAQLCRYGPIWAGVFAAIAETVRAEIKKAKARETRSEQ